MFSAYLKMERRQSVRKDGTEIKTPRYAGTAQAGYFKPLKALKNAKNEIIMYYQRNDKCNPNSTAETRLQCKGGINFSSIYFLNLTIGTTLIGYGEPPKNQFFKNGKLNPFYENRNDGYLFTINSDYSTIEILIVSNGRYLIQGAAKQLADGKFDEAIKTIREQAKPIE
ncbi:MAG: hypothetical protein LBQ31_03390 [Bacteroidales bacterium]|jgi:hypothetical protein|nr:hypothetical protein [Bacteroidales bacterium]